MESNKKQNNRRELGSNPDPQELIHCATELFEIVGDK